MKDINHIDAAAVHFDKVRIGAIGQLNDFSEETKNFTYEIVMDRLSRYMYMLTCIQPSMAINPFSFEKPKYLTHHKYLRFYNDSVESINFSNMKALWISEKSRPFVFYINWDYSDLRNAIFPTGRL